MSHFDRCIWSAASRSVASSKRATATRPQAQLAEALAAFDLTPDPARLLTRCTLCNTPVAEADANPPQGVRGRNLAFFRCPSCGQLYWRGSHVERILADRAPALREQSH